MDYGPVPLFSPACWNSNVHGSVEMKLRMDLVVQDLDEANVDLASLGPDGQWYVRFEMECHRGNSARSRQRGEWRSRTSGQATDFSIRSHKKQSNQLK